MFKNTIRSITVVGGGTAGWMTAAALSKHFKDSGVSITVVDSSEIGTVGVGEATIPTLRRFYSNLGFTDTEVMKATQATCKLGIEFQDWHKKGSSFIHPFGTYGQKANGIPFHNYWLKLKQLGDDTDIADYSLGVSMAKANKFAYPSPKPKTPLSIFDWALHFDAGLFGQLMKSSAIDNGAKHIDKRILNVNLHPSEGFIESLDFEDSSQLEADLFIDCSGFKALLIERALKTGYQDWSQWLLCDKAVAVQSKSTSVPLPRTISKAHNAGWQWKIPLQHRQGNGHVYASEFISDEEALKTLLEHIDGDLISEPKHFSFTPGRRNQAWNKNCIAVGLASGFLEPLESTSIALVETAIEKIILSFEKPEYTQETINRFNEVTATEYERIRDFIILHYKLNQRRDSPFWQRCRDIDVPSELQDKMNAFKEQSELKRYPWEIFGPDSWIAIYSGFNYLPKQYNSNVDKLDTDYLQKALAEMRSSVKSAVDSLPTHSDFLKDNCQFEPLV